MSLLPVPLAFELNGNRLTILEIHGVLYFIVKEVGQFLGYQDGGLTDLIASEWREELKSGTHTLMLEGETLAMVKGMNWTGITRPVDPHTRSLLLLTEPGLWRVLILTGKPAGIALRDKLDSEILPSIRKTGSYAVPTTPRAELDVAGWVRALPAELASLPANKVLELMLAELVAGPLPTYRALLVGQGQPAEPRNGRVPDEKRKEILAWWAERPTMFSSEVAKHWGVTASAVRTWKMRAQAGVN